MKPTACGNPGITYTARAVSHALAPITRGER